MTHLRLGEVDADFFPSSRAAHSPPVFVYIGRKFAKEAVDEGN